eukprot:CAMPEP_0182498606 /NCGR_PEP_ID=MMETSP1321-20130603/6759_1 /TAXON_ID=91990 /ORGANISM="Bolidomonas sp., Strain RCC1657" /LENGTH=929 /DNA_ID=CAMNT_0024702689 /DNA_START=95 /DNA_END=2881 /DNA_ORIENTATION=+
MNGQKLLLLLSAILAVGNSLVAEKRVKSVQSWKLVDRFCFKALYNHEYEDPEVEGVFELSVTFKIRDKISVSLFIEGDNDAGSNWPEVHIAPASEMNCAERQSGATKTLNLWKTNVCQTMTNPCEVFKPYPWANNANPAIGQNLVTVDRSFSFKSKVPQWMYVVISNCDDECDEETCESIYGCHCQSTVDIDYSFKFIQADKSHFSADESGVLPCTQAYFAFQCLNLLFIIIIRGKLMHRRKYHWTVHMLAISIFIHLVALLLAMIHYSMYDADGVGDPILLEISAYLNIACETLFIALLILLAKGWTIVRRKISPGGRIKIAVFCSIYFLSGIFAKIWSHLSYDVAEVTYVYESPPGTMLLILRTLAALWFYYAGRTTRINFEKKKGFYFKFNNFFLFWLLALPFVIAMASSIDRHRRFMIYYAFNLTLIWLGQTVLCILYNPSTQFNRSFPFHSHTSSMLGMLGTDKSKKDTVMFSSSRSNRMTKIREVNAANAAKLQGALTTPISSVGGSNLVQNKYQEANTNSIISTVSGGLGIQKSRAGQIVIKNQFDAMHFLRIKSVSDAVKEQLSELTEKSTDLDSILDAITIENPGQYGKIGYEYTSKQNKRENLLSAAEPPERVSNFLASAATGNAQKKSSPPHVNTTWSNQEVDRLRVKENPEVFEMIKRVTSNAASGDNRRSGRSDRERDGRGRGKDLGDDDSAEMDRARHGRRSRDRSQERSPREMSREKPRETSRSPESEPQTSPPDTNGRDNSDDEFDHPVSGKPPKRRTSKTKSAPPSGPPPSRRASANTAVLGKPKSREGSRRNSREDSRDSSPRAERSPGAQPRRAPMNSLDTIAGRGAVKGFTEETAQHVADRLSDLKEVEGEGKEEDAVVKKKKKKKKEKKEKKERSERSSKEGGSRGGSGELAPIGPPPKSSRNSSRRP